LSTLWIREYSAVGAAPSAANAGASNLLIPAEPGTDQTPLTFSTTAQSAAFAAGTKFVEIQGSAAFHYVVGADPTATTNALRVAASENKLIAVTAGHKIAAINAA